MTADVRRDVRAVLLILVLGATTLAAAAVLLRAATLGAHPAPPSALDASRVRPAA